LVVVGHCVGQLAVVAEELLGFRVEESVFEHGQVSVVVEVSRVELDDVDLSSVEGGVLEFELAGKLRSQVYVSVGFHVIGVDEKMLVGFAVSLDVETDLAVNGGVSSFLICKADVDVLGGELEAAEVEHDGNVEFP